MTKIATKPCVVTQVKTLIKDGYWAIQLGFGTRTLKNVTKPMQGHLKGVIKNKMAPVFLVEVRFSEESSYKVGDEIDATQVFKVGDFISVVGTSKGKGFAGAVKRWGFAGGSRTHGQSDRERAPGSIGAGTTPGRVYKGKHMAGRMGTERIMIKNVQVVSLSSDTGEIVVSGPVPGIKNGYLVITKLAEGHLKGMGNIVAQVVEDEVPKEEVKAEENIITKEEVHA